MLAAVLHVTAAARTHCSYPCDVCVDWSCLIVLLGISVSIFQYDDIANSRERVCVCACVTLNIARIYCTVVVVAQQSVEFVCAWLLSIPPVGRRLAR